MKKKLLGIILAAALSVCALVICANAEAQNATLIGTADELLTVMNDTNYWNDYITLTADINLAEATNGLSQATIGKSATLFTGTFNGNGHTISGLNVGDSSTQYVGLFGALQGATVNDLTVYGNVTASSYGGGIAGFARNSVIENCTSYVTVNGNFSGGIVGFVKQSSASGTTRISKCVNNGTVSGTQRLGGIVGYFSIQNSGTSLIIEHCVNNGAVSGTGNIVGGILGYLEMTSAASGTNYFTIHNCANNADITAKQYAGGIMGCFGTTASASYDVRTTLTNLYNKGAIASTNTADDGSIIGLWRAPMVTDSAYNVVWSDWHNEGTCAFGLVGTLAYFKADFSAANLYNQASENMIDASTSTTSCASGDYTITLTNSYNSASADLSALANDANWATSADGTVGLLSMEKVADTSIDSAEEFIILMNDSSAWGGDYTLSADIDLTGYYQRPIGTVSIPFTGSFDGNEHSISGINISGGINIGLFGYTEGATIKNLTINGAVTAAGDASGALIGTALLPLTVENVTNNVTLTSSGRYAGAIVGMLYSEVSNVDAIISGCINNANITAGSYAGGIVGVFGTNFNTLTFVNQVDVEGIDIAITKCKNNGDLTITAGNVAGGIMGYNMYRGTGATGSLSITKSANYGAISATAGGYIGGILGAHLEGNNVRTMTLTLTELYNAGTIDASSTTYMGSIVALTRVSKLTDGVAPYTISDCWNTGVASYGMFGVFGASACTWSASRLYNAIGTYIIAKNTTVSGEVTANSNTITLTDCFNSSSDAATVLAALVTTTDETDESCVWVNRYDSPELKEFAQAKAEVTLDNVIDSEEELVLLMNSSDRWEEDYTLGANLNLEGYSLSPIGTSDIPYTGTFDGAGYTLSGMTINGSKGVGLFGYVSDATIKELTITDATVSGTDSAAALVGVASGSLTVENCTVNAAVTTTGARAGVLIGDIPSVSTTVTSISGCTTSGSVDAGTGHAGGLVGRTYANKSLTIKNCSNSATIEGPTEAGGLIGRMPITTKDGVVSITNCSNSGAVTATESAGGIVGETQAYCAYTMTVSGCTNTGKIFADTNYAGGIYGLLNNYYASAQGYSTSTVTFDDNINKGDVEAEVYVGGIIGHAYFKQHDTALTFTNSENHNAILGGVFVGGTIGRLEYTGVNPDGTAPTQSANISNLANYGSVTADDAITTNTNKGRYVGGVIGFVTTEGSAVKLDRLYNEGAVVADVHYAGGITSYLRSYGNAGTGNNTATDCLITLSNSENRGTVTNVGSHTGGIAGFLTNIAQVTVKNCVNSGAVSGNGTTNAIVGCPDGISTVNHVIENCFYSCTTADTYGIAVAADTDFSALDTSIWTIPVSGHAYAPELTEYHDHVEVATYVDDTNHSLNCWCGGLTATTEAHTLDANGSCTKCTYSACNHSVGEVTISYDADRAAVVYTRTCCDSELYVDTTLNTTVYVASTAAELVPSLTVEAAIDTFKNFEFAMQYAALVANVKGDVTIVINDLAEVTTASYQTPAYEGMITITGSNGTDTKGVLCFNIESGSRRWYANGDVTFEKLSFKTNATNGVRIFAQNHTMVFGTGITMDNDDVVYKTDGSVDIGSGFAKGVNNVKMYVNGGFENNNSQPMNTNLTVRSGDYWFIGGWNLSSASYDNYGTGTITVGKQDDSDYLFTRYLVGYSTGAQELTAASKVTITIDGEFNCEYFYVGTQNDIASNKDMLYETDIYLKGNMNSEADDNFGIVDLAGTVTTTNTRVNVYVDCTNAEALKDSYLFLGGDPAGAITQETVFDNMNTVLTADHIGNTGYVWTKDGDNYVIACSLCGTVVKSQTDAPTVYVGDDGDDTADGLTADTKVATLTEAARRIAAVGGTVMFDGYVTLSENTTLADWGENTITFKTETLVDGIAQGGIYVATDLVQLTLGGAAKFDTFALKGKSSGVDCVIINAMWYNVDFTRIHSANYGCCYLMAGQWGATESDDTEVTQVINVEGHTTDTARAYFFGRIYMGSEMQTAGMDISNKNITLNLKNGYANADATERTIGAQVNTIYTMSTTGNDTYATANTSNCVSTVNFDGDMSVYNFRTGDRNVDRVASTASLDALYLNFMGNSQIDNSAVIRNCYNTFIKVSNEDEGRTEPLTHSFFFSGKGTFADADAEVSVTYGSHSLISTIACPPVTLDYDGDGAAYVLVSDDFTNECTFTSEITTEPGDTTFGERTYTCDCGRSYTELICGTYAHKYVQQAPGVYVCELCGDISDTLLMPDGSVLITAAASTITDGKVTVDIIIDADAFAATHFTVDAPEGFTLESVTDVADDSFDLYYTESLALPCQIMLINPSATNAAVANTKVATLTFAVDTSVFTEDGEIVITNVETVDESENNISYVVTVNATVSPVNALELDVRYGLSVILKGDFRLEFLVQTTEAVDKENSWIEIEGVEGNVAPHTVTEEVSEDGATTTTTLRFFAPDIAAKEMNDAIYYSFHTKVDGVEYAGETTSRNIVNYYEYARDYFAPYAGQGQVDSMMNLMYTMLNYGAAAQTYFGYNTDVLVNEHLDADKRVDYTATDVTAEGAWSQEAVEGQLYTVSEMYVTLEQDVVLTLKFTGDNITEDSIAGLTYIATYTNYDGETIKVTSDNIYVADGLICVDIDTVSPKDFREELAGGLYSGETQVSSTVTASIEAYAADIIGGNHDEALTTAGYNVANLKAVCRALLAYSDAAKDLFYKITVNPVEN